MSIVISAYGPRTFEGTISFSWLYCYREDCRCPFAMEAGFIEHLKATKDSFYCPRGHEQAFSGKSEQQKLREENERLKRSVEYQEQRADQNWKYAQNQERAKKMLSTKLKRTKTRIANGVCPCCNRSFVKLAAHMKTKHPGYAAKKTKLH